MDDFAAKQVAELWLVNQPERRRVVVFRASMLMTALTSLLFVGTYLHHGHPEALPWVIYPFLIPALLVFALSFTHFSHRVIYGSCFYLITVNVLTRLLAEPVYLTDVIIFAAFVAVCYSMLRPSEALGLTIYHLIGLVTASLVVHLYRPFNIIYHNSDGLHGFIAASIGTSLVVWVMSHLQSRNAEKYFSELRERVLEILQLNQDQHLLLGVVLHDFSNDLMRAMMVADRLRSGPVDPDMGKRLDLALNSMADLISQLKRLRHGGGLAIDASSEPVRLGDVLDRARLGFRDLLKQHRVQLQISGDLNVIVGVPLIILSASIVNNILSNAIKFSAPEQTVKVVVRRRDGVAALTVVNIGPRTDSEGFRASFDGSVHKSESDHNERGQGIGLRIAVRFCERMGIRIWGEQATNSDSQTMTTVQLEIPLAE